MTPRIPAREVIGGTEDDSVDLELRREIFWRAWVVRLHQPEIRISIGVTRGEKDRPFFVLAAWERFDIC